MKENIESFQLPKYNEIPNVGLYLEQTVKYINMNIEKLGYSITASMITNYVKQGYIARPVKKQYYAEQIAYLIFISFAKQVLSMENIDSLLRLQQKTYTTERAYNYFCTELENTVINIFSGREVPLDNEELQAFPKKTLHSVVIAVAHMIYLRDCFTQLEK